MRETQQISWYINIYFKSTTYFESTMSLSRVSSWILSRYTLSWSVILFLCCNGWVRELRKWGEESSSVKLADIKFGSLFGWVNCSLSSVSKSLLKRDGRLADLLPGISLGRRCWNPTRAKLFLCAGKLHKVARDYLFDWHPKDHLTWHSESIEKKSCP